MKYEIAIYLSLVGSETIRNTLKERGFAIFKVNSLTGRYISTSSNEDLHDYICCDFIYCIYNGEKSPEQLGINLKELEREDAVFQVKISYKNTSYSSFLI